MIQLPKNINMLQYYSFCDSLEYGGLEKGCHIHIYNLIRFDICRIEMEKLCTKWGRLNVS